MLFCGWSSRDLVSASRKLYFVLCLIVSVRGESLSIASFFFVLLFVLPSLPFPHPFHTWPREAA